MREIVFDTETTGFEPKSGDKIVEIGAIELVNHVPTGSTYHAYINPERDMPPGAFEVHGLSEEFLSDKPVFQDVATAFLDYIGSATLVAHNAQFDMKFLNFELRAVGLEPIIEAARVIDTLEIARRKFPNGPNSLDHLCTRFGIDNARRTKHGALLDSELLAEVYIELLGGRQTRLALSEQLKPTTESAQVEHLAVNQQTRPTALPPRLTELEKAAHRQFLIEMPEPPIWQKYRDGSAA